MLATAQVTSVHLDLTTLTLLVNLVVGIGLPHLVALVTHIHAPGWFKGFTLLALASIAGALTQWLGAPTADWRAWLLSWAQLFLVAVVAHYGLTKDLTTGSNGILARLFPGGFGPIAPAAAPTETPTGQVLAPPPTDN